MQSAELNFKDKRYNTAFSFYEKYISRYPEGEMVPDALLQMGVIKGRQKRYAEAAAHLTQVMRKYPQTPYAPQAGVEMMAVLNEAGDFEAVVRQAADVFSYGLDEKQFTRAGLITGDAYMALNLPQEAYFAFLRTYRQAGRKAAAEDVMPRLKAAINLLPVEKIRNELARLDGRPPSGYLMYHLASNYVGAGHIGDAIGVFSDFVDRYPDHELAGKAETRLAELKASGLADQVNIGCLLPLTGRYETFGNQALRGIELALSMPMAAELEPPLNLIIADTASDPEQAAKAVEMFNEKQVAVIIGPIATAEAAAEAAQANEIPIITLTQASEIPKIGQYVFRNFITPEMQVSTLSAYASETLGVDQFAMLYPDEPYGKTFMNMFWDELLARNASVVGLEAYNPAHTDFSDPIKKLVGLYYDVPEDIAKDAKIGPVARQQSPFEAFWGIGGNDQSQDYGSRLEAPLMPYLNKLPGEAESDPDEEPDPVVDFRAVFIPDSPEKAGLILPQLAYYDVNDVYLLGTNLWHSDRFIQMAPHHVQGAICTSGFFAGSRSASVKEFVEKFKSVYASEPSFIEAISYDTAKMIADVLQNFPYFGRSYIQAQLAEMPPYDGITGKTRFDETGEAIKDLYLLRVAGRRFVEVEY